MQRRRNSGSGFGPQSQRLQAISVLETTLFLPVWANRSVALVPRYSRARGATQRPLPAGGRPVAALVFHALRQPQPKGGHPCAAGGGCAHICVTAWRGAAPHAHCLCRHGYRLAGHGDCVREYLRRVLATSGRSGIA